MNKIKYHKVEHLFVIFNEIYACMERVQSHATLTGGDRDFFKSPERLITIDKQLITYSGIKIDSSLWHK